MKNKYLTGVVVVCLLIVNMVNAAPHATYPTLPNGNGLGIISSDGDTIFIQGGLANQGNFETVINGDVDAKGKRLKANRIYVLEAGQGVNSCYFQNAALNISDSAGTVTIIGLPLGDGLQRPVLVKNELNSHPVQVNYINANLTIENIQYESEDLQNNYPPADQEWTILGTFHKLTAKNNLFEFDQISLFGMQSVTQGAKAILEGNYFRDFFYGGQWWGGRVIFAEVPMDTLIYENNTSTGTGLLWLGQNSLNAFALIDHNTIINNVKYAFMDDFYLEAYFTNNLIINGGLAGDDSNTLQTEDPDSYPEGVFGIDTINSQCTAIQPRYCIGDSLGGVPDQNKVGFAQWQILVSNNVEMTDQQPGSPLGNYFTNSAPYNDALKGCASSYLQWVGNDTPYTVFNAPQVFLNSRFTAIQAVYPNNVKISDNIYGEDAPEPSALGFTTPTLDTAQANIFIQFNRGPNGYQIPGVVVPVAYPGATNTKPFARFAFGDFDPATFPGPDGTEVSYKTATGGIKAFTDLKENFNQSVYTSKIDSLPVGSLIWGAKPTILVDTTQIRKIKSAYANPHFAINSATGINSATLTVGPNPTSELTTITVNLPFPTNVLLTVNDVSGNVVKTIVDGSISSGNISFDASVLTDGLYILVLKTDQTVLTSKLIKQ